MELSPGQTWDTVAAYASRVALAPIAALSAHQPPALIEQGLRATAQTSHALNVVDEPIRAAAAGTGLSTMQRVAGFFTKALPTATVVINTLNGARIVDRGGTTALIRTREGRGAVLGAAGGGLMLVPTPPTQLGAAGLLALAAANEFGALKRLDRPIPGSTTATARSTRPV